MLMDAQLAMQGIPGSIIGPAKRYRSKEAAERAASGLALGERDGWTYTAKRVGSPLVVRRWVVEVRDERGEFAGYWS